MIKKNTTCVHCGREIESSKRASKMYCSTKCRLFHFRENSTKPSANKYRRNNNNGLLQSTQQSVEQDKPTIKSDTVIKKNKSGDDYINSLTPAQRERLLGKNQ